MVGVADGGDCFVIRTTDGFLLKTFAINGYACDAAAFSSDGRFLALSGRIYLGQLLVRVYETKGWTEVTHITAPEGGGAIFSPDARYLLVSTTIFLGTAVYAVATWEHLRTLDGIGPSVSPDSQLVAVLGSRPPSIHLFRLEDGTEVTPPSGYLEANYLLGNDWIALAAGDQIRIETLVEPPQIIAALTAPHIVELRISPDRQSLVGILDDGESSRMLQLWETKSFSSLRSWSIGRSSRVTAGLAFVSNDFIVSSNPTSDDARVDLWRVSDGQLLQALNTDKGIYTALVYSPDGTVVVAGFGSNGNIRAWQASDGLALQTISGTGRLTSLAFTNDGQYLVGGGDHLSVWSWPDGYLVQSVPQSAQDIAVSSRGVVAQRTSDEIRLRTLPGLMLFRAIPRGGPISFSPDGNLILVDGDLFEVDTGQLLRTFPYGPTRNSTFSPDGMNVVLSRGGRIDRFDVTSGDLVAQFGLRDATYIDSLSFSPDGARLAAFSGQSTFRSAPLDVSIWDGFAVLYQDYNDDLGLNGGRAHYSPDGRYLAVVIDSFPYFLFKTFGVALDPCAEGGCVSKK